MLLCGVGAVEFFQAITSALRHDVNDLRKQVTVAKYMRRGINPYPVAVHLLVANYGLLAPRGPVHLRELRIYGVPKTGPHVAMDPALGSPDATYPPGSVLMIAPVSLLPPEIADRLWIVLNVILVFLIVRELRRFDEVSKLRLPLVLGLVLAWPATSYCIEGEQFTLISLFCILVAYRIEAGKPVSAGLLLAVSLIKPSVSLPFLVLPLVDERLTVSTKLRLFGTIAAVHLTLLAAACWMVHAGPVELIRGWVSVASYFRQGMYTADDVINILHLDGSFIATAVLVCMLGGAFAGARVFGPGKRLAFLAIVSCIWAHHNDYDFVALLIPVILLVPQPAGWKKTALLGAAGIVAIGLLHPVYMGSAGTRPIRYAARISMAMLLAGFSAIPFAKSSSPQVRRVEAGAA